MITVLEYLVIAAVIGLVVFVIAVFVFGRGEQMAALSPRVSPSALPDRAIGGDDVRTVRFGLALRGYRMSDVDWTLDRLADEIDGLQRRLAGLTGEPLPPGVPADRGDLFAPGADEGPEASHASGADEGPEASHASDAVTEARTGPAPGDETRHHGEA